jgi:FkbM family methyltransferase
MAGWTWAFLQRYRGIVAWRSLWNLRAATLAPRSHALLDLRLRRPPARVRFRPNTTDFWTFNEVLVDGLYAGILAAAPIRTVIDLGANIGFASLYLRAHAPEARILAVEPDAANVALLEHNLPDATILQGAFWYVDGPVPFEAATPTTGAVAESATSVTVPGYTMASIVDRSGFDIVDVLKVDIEGAERHLFAGDNSWLDRVRGLVLEFHGDARAASGFDTEMARRGFRVHEAPGHTVIAIRP